MKKKITITALFLSLPVLGYIVLGGGGAPLQVDHARLDGERQNFEHRGGDQYRQADSKSAPTKNIGWSTDPIKSTEYISPPPTLKALRSKIASAKENKDFIQTVLDIEYSASFEDITPLVRELYDVWVTKDPVAALEYSNVLTERFDDSGFRRYVLEKAAGRSIAETQEWLDKHNAGSPDEQDQNRLAIYSGLAANDPIAALQHLSSIENDRYKQQLKLRSLEEWAKFEPSQAIAWLEAESSSMSQNDINDAYVVAVYPMIETAPLQAESIILGLNDSHQKNALVNVYTQKLALSDSDAAIAWAQNISDVKAQKIAVSATLDVLAGAEETRSKAIAFANAEANMEQREELLTRAIGYIAKRDPYAAAKNLTSLTFDEQKDVAVSVIYSFSEEDSESRRQWLESLPSQELREFVEGVTSG